MKVIPVLDLQQGCVVRGIGGRRTEYLPLTPECQPLEVARLFRERFGLSELYVADLDAIAGADPAILLYTEFHHHGFSLWVDAGIRAQADAKPLIQAGIESVVVGLETLRGPEPLRELCNEHSARIVFSLDLRNGVPLGDVNGWRSADPRSIAEEAIALGVRRLLLLDLARVGTNTGTGTEFLTRQLIDSNPHVEVTVGGGVRDVADLRRLKALGLHAVLVASALHDGKIQPQDLANL